MIKKIIGYFLIIISTLLGIAIIAILPKILIEILKLISMPNDGYQIGYVFGHLIGLTLIALSTYAIWKFGNKLIKRQ